MLIINGHGGNQADMSMALQNRKEQYEDSRVFRASYWKVAEKQLDEIREGPHGWGHAGVMETSNPVKADLPQQDGTHPESERRARVAVSAHGREDRSDGDPTFDTAEKRECMLDAVADSLAEVVRDIQSGKF